MKGLFCPNCKTDKHNIKYEKDYFYVCDTCGKPLGYLCKGCDRVYLENRLILHDDLYVCKECGQPQYGYTEWKRENN